MVNTAWKVSLFRVFVVRIFSYSGWIRKHKEYLSVFSPNAGKCGPEKLLLHFLRSGIFTAKNHEMCFRTSTLLFSSVIFSPPSFLPESGLLKMILKYSHSIQAFKSYEGMSTKNCNITVHVIFDIEMFIIPVLRNQKTTLLNNFGY